MILIYPDRLSDKGKMKMMLDYLHCPYTYNVGDNYDMVFNSSVNPKHTFDLDTDKFVINRNCNNVLKDNIDKLWFNVSGKSLKVNTDTFKGYCIEKPLTQGLNTGNVVKCPLSQKGGMMYQKLIDNRVDAHTIMDYRVVMMKQEIVLILEKKKSVTEIFGNPYRYKEVDNVFSDEEIHRIKVFSEFFDFAEIDVLRSNFDGDIYVIDVNNLPGNGYFRDKDLLDFVANKFKEYFL